MLWNIANAYKSTPLPPLGLSDHNTVLLTPKYRSKLKTSKPTTKTVNLWTEETTQVLQECLDTTDWDMFKEKTRDIHELTDKISCYLHCCEKNVITSKEIKCYPNNKPWVSMEPKELLNLKKNAFLEKDQNKIKETNKLLKLKIAEGKKRYKEKIEHSFRSNDIKTTWASLKKATDHVYM